MSNRSGTFLGTYRALSHNRIVNPSVHHQARTNNVYIAHIINIQTKSHTHTDTQLCNLTTVSCYILDIIIDIHRTSSHKTPHVLHTRIRSIANIFVLFCWLESCLSHTHISTIMFPSILQVHTLTYASVPHVSEQQRTLAQRTQKVTHRFTVIVPLRFSYGSIRLLHIRPEPPTHTRILAQHN